MGAVNIAGFEVGHAVRSADGFAVAGDAVMVRHGGDRIVLAIIDVLGHGREASVLASTAERVLEEAPSTDAARLLALLDHSLSGSIGAAAAIVTIETQTGRGCYVGVGNTMGRAMGQSERRLSSVDGIVGKGHPTPRAVEFSLGPGELLILHTDGISSRFAVAEYPQLLVEDVVVSARELIRRFGKPYDDAACIVARRTA